MITKQADLTTELKPHQQRVVGKLQRADQPGLVVAHGLGSGKTLTSIAAQEALGMPSDVLVPAALQANYKKEIAKHTAGETPDRAVQSIQNVASKGLAPKAPLLIVDEAHRIREPGTKAYKTIAKNKSEKRILLTGSPFYNHPADIAPLINVASGLPLLPAQRADFSDKYIATKKIPPPLWDRIRGVTPGEEEVVNPKRTKELRNVFGKWVDYHPGSTDEFPEVTREDVSVPMTKKQLEVYDSVLEKAPFWVQAKIKAKLPPSKQESKQLNAFLSAARQISNTTEPFQEGKGSVLESPKIDVAFSKLQDQLNQNERAKAVVYSNYLKAGVEPYRAKLMAANIPFGEFTGDMPKKVRDELVRRYNENKLKVLLLSSAGGEGLDLKGTRLIQMLDPHWNSEKLKQVEGRGIRFRSHSDLPPEERKVLVQRFLATRPRSGLLEKLHLKAPGGSTDEYLAQRSEDKERLIQQFRSLLPTEPVTIPT